FELIDKAFQIFTSQGWRRLWKIIYGEFRHRFTRLKCIIVKFGDLAHFPLLVRLLAFYLNFEVENTLVLIVWLGIIHNHVEIKFTVNFLFQLALSIFKIEVVR